MRVSLAFIMVLFVGATSCGGDHGGDQVTTTTGGPTTTTVALTATTTVALTTTTAYVPPPYAVTTMMVSGEETQDIWVFAPEGDGPWPFVFALPGHPGDAKQDLERFATDLAGHGVVVFAANWPAMADAAVIDGAVECGYRYSLSIGEEYGADLTQPIAIVGNSAGATAALNLAIRESKFGPDGSYDRCYEGVPRPALVVALSGCHSFRGFPARIIQWGNTDADYVLVHGGADTLCGISQSEEAADVLRDRDYPSVEVVEIPGAGHGELVFWTKVSNSQWEPLPVEHQTGQLAIDIVLDVIATAQR